MSFDECELSGSYLSYENKLYSTSPEVFREFDFIITSIESNIEEELKMQMNKLKYSLVMKDIIINDLKKKMKDYEWSHYMWSSFTKTFLQ